LCGCIVQIRTKPRPKPDDPVPVVANNVKTCVKIYGSKASDVFAKAAVILRRDKDIKAIHGYLKENMAKMRSESFEGLDNRLQEVLGVEEPDIEACANLLEQISKEYKELSK